MKQLTCEMCGSTELVKQDSFFVCQTCGCKYSVEEAKKMMIEGTVDVQGTVKVDNSAFVEKYLANARRALAKEDWEEVEKYYDMVEQNQPNNIEAIFYSAYGKVMSTLVRAFDEEIRATMTMKSTMLKKSISVISEYYEQGEDEKQKLLTKIAVAIKRIYEVPKELLASRQTTFQKITVNDWLQNEINSIRDAYVAELRQIHQMCNESFILPLIEEVKNNKFESRGGCYVATCVYGSYDCPQVWTLRRFRDDTLGSTWYGRLFIRTYYAISPTLVKWFGNTNWFKKLWKGKLDRMVAKLQNNGVEDTPYEDKEW